MRTPNKVPENSEITGLQLKRVVNQLIDAVKAIRPNGDGKTIKVSKTPSGATFSVIEKHTDGGETGGGGGATILWAKVTTVGDANNYTVSVYNRKDEGTPVESGKQCRVFDIVDTLAVGDWFPVQSSGITGEDYECIQQLGDL